MLKGIELGKALERAIEMKGVTKADVARHFKVKPPSVSEWVKFGRIGKNHITELVAYFSDVVGPQHWGLDFDPSVTTFAEKYQALSLEDRMFVDLMIKGLEARHRLEEEGDPSTE